MVLGTFFGLLILGALKLIRRRNWIVYAFIVSCTFLAGVVQLRWTGDSAARFGAVLMLTSAIVLTHKISWMRIALWNLLFLGIFLVSAEAVLRFVSDSIGVAGEVSAETYRDGRADGPDTYPPFSTTSQSERRTTVGQPPTHTRRVLFWGGSTTACNEVPDGLTYASQLQSLLSTTSPKTRVENWGSSATTFWTQVRDLEQIVDLREGDLVVFYIGVNEAGSALRLREVPNPLLVSVPRLKTLVHRLSEFSILFDKVARESIAGATLDDGKVLNVVGLFEESLLKIKSIVDQSDASLAVVLQPNVFTKYPQTEYERGLVKLFDPGLPAAMDAMYGHFVRVLNQSAVQWFDGRGIMDSLKRSPYYDWHHVDARGNAEIANFMLDNLELSD
jgi:hypothetical protein